jgi:hypothetical protein
MQQNDMFVGILRGAEGMELGAWGMGHGTEYQWRIANDQKPKANS